MATVGAGGLAGRAALTHHAVQAWLTNNVATLLLAHHTDGSLAVRDHLQNSEIVYWYVKLHKTITEQITYKIQLTKTCRC